MRRHILMPVWLGLLVLLSGGCSSYESPLTQPTETGANSLSCRVNGDIWVPRVSPLSIMPHLAGSVYKRQLGVSAVRQKDTYEFLDFLSDSIHDIGPQRILEARFETYRQVVHDSSELYITKFDTTARIVAGRFSLFLIDDKGSIVRITDGRFDFKY